MKSTTSCIDKGLFIIFATCKALLTMNDITLKDIFEAQRRIASIALKTPLTLSEIEQIKEDALTESLVAEHGLFNAKGEDIQDEMQFLGTDRAENLDEEDESVFAVSPELRNALSGKR